MTPTTRWRLAQYFERRWWNSYLANKPVDEYLAWKKKYWQHMLDSLRLLRPDLTDYLKEPEQQVLDAGCGPAGIFLILEEHEVTAFDPLWNNYRQQFSQFEYERMDYIKFEQADLETYQPPREFDTVFCMNALNHVADIGASIETLKKAIKPGGLIILSLDVHVTDFLNHLFRAIPGDILHPHQYTLPGYIRLLESHGLHFVANQCFKRGRIFDHHMVIVRKK